MEWFINIFSDQSDKARLVTTLIAAIIAVSVVLLNQWFNSKRLKKEKYIEKIEEIYTVIIEMGDLVSNMYSDIVYGYEMYKRNMSRSGVKFYEEDSDVKIKKLGDMQDEIYRLESKAYMLSSLYFRELQSDLQKYKENFHTFSLALEASDSFNDYIDDTQDYRNEMKVSLNGILRKLAIIMEKQLEYSVKKTVIELFKRIFVRQ